ncbi:hypothetical protein CHS0354_003118 [Potamilus streckersoni]|uniref:HMA domain-containing protein n=1 Tax=Potamilus streckersoni TaxID=2493646 RepID=A0AAE0VGR8_9BIVA|nr:hypothetical protein CHS0354_003118 [Potamilus streckersoni]
MATPMLLEDDGEHKRYSPNKVPSPIIIEKIDKMGFDASLEHEPSVERDFDKIATRNAPETQACLIDIVGMTCMSCVRNIESNITGTPGIVNIKVSLEKNNALVQYDPSVTSPKDIADKIDSMGFEAKVSAESPSPLSVSLEDKTEFIVINIKGMTRISCVKNIEEKLSDHLGVKIIKVSFAEQNGNIEYFPSCTTPQILCDAIAAMGFETSIPASAVDYDVVVRPNGKDVKPAFGRGKEVFKNTRSVGQDDKCYLKINGMIDALSINTIEENVMKLECVEYVQVSLMAEVKYAADCMSPLQITDKITSMGLKATVLKLEKVVKSIELQKTLVKQNSQSLMRSFCSLYMIGTANGIGFRLTLSQALRSTAHLAQ